MTRAEIIKHLNIPEAHIVDDGRVWLRWEDEHHSHARRITHAQLRRLLEAGLVQEAGQAGLTMAYTLVKTKAEGQ